MEDRIRKVVKGTLAGLGAGEVTFAVEWPAEMAHGDFAVNAALAASKALGRSPREIAEQIAEALKNELAEAAASVEVAGPGFINITLAEHAVSLVLDDALTQEAEWGKNTEHAGKSVMVEYGNPNPFKEMHIGHMVGTVIGEAMARLLEGNGAHVVRDTFGGDVGPQVAKALWAFQKDGVTDVASAAEIGKAYTHGATAYEESETAKAEIDALNVRLYDIVSKKDENASFSEDDRALLYLWQKGREVSMEEFSRLFAILGTRHDYTFFDSDTTEPGMTAVAGAVSHGVLKESEGAVIYEGDGKTLNTVVFITSRGTPTYATKDIGLAFLKEMQAPTDEVIVLTAIEQQGHFLVVLKALEDIAPQLAAKTSHLSHGLLTLTTGKMSSRKGNVITAAELIKELVEETSKRNADPIIAQQVAIGALKYMVLRSAPGGNIIFDPEKSLSLDGDSGPYLQYALVRAESILAKAPDFDGREVVASHTPPELARLIPRFPGIVKKAQALRGPHVLTQYLTQLAGEWNSFYAQERIIGGEHELYNLKLARAFALTMKNGLELLGIPVPNQM